MKSPAPQEKKPELIVIVDDEACVRESLSSLVRSVGYKVEDFASAESFLATGKLQETACLILDVRLPGMGGLELQQCLRENRNEPPPIVFISGHATEMDQGLATRRGAVAFLRKPFSDESLLKAVRESIDRRTVNIFAQDEPSRQVCPLCHEFAEVGDIPDRLMHLPEELRALTVGVVGTVKPGWRQEDGLCEQCWTFYFDLGRVLDVSKKQSGTAPTIPFPAGARGD